MTRSAPRLLHICETARGGIATYLSALHLAGVEAEGSMYVLPREHLGQAESGMRTAAFRRERRGPLAVVRMLIAARRAYVAARPDVIFFHSFFSAIALVFARAGGTRARLVYCGHGWAASRYAPGSARFRLAGFVERRICGLADAVVCISRHELEFAERSGYRGRLVVIENAVRPAAAGARPDRFADGAGDWLELLFVGRFDRQKGLDILLEAFRDASGQRPDLRLHVVGEAVLDRPTDRASAGSSIVFHGWVDPSELDDFYRSADALVVPSRWEGFGLVVAEAFRNGTPVLASNRGALPDLVEPDVSGFVFHLDVENLVQLLARLNRDELRGMRDAARESYERRFGIERFGRDLAALYSSLAPRMGQRHEQDDAKTCSENAGSAGSCQSF